MKYLITGGLGFIGSYFAEKLSQHSGNEITIIDNLSGASQQGHELLKTKDNIEIYIDDINGKNADLYKYIDVVYHFAANSKISEGVNNPDIDFEISTKGTHSVLKNMIQNNVPKIVYTSGSGVYGDQKYDEVSENFGPLLPVSYYGASKLAAEGYIAAFCGMKGIKSHIFRFANVVGKRQTHGVVYDFFHKLKNDSSKLEVLGDGLQSKSYIDVEDIYQAVQTVVKENQSSVDVYNVATNDYISVKDIAEIVISEMELDDVNVHYGKNSGGWIGDVPIIRFSSTKIRNLGWKNALTSEQAIRNAIKTLIKDDNF
mgnify:CR=1 FL=1